MVQIAARVLPPTPFSAVIICSFTYFAPALQLERQSNKSKEIQSQTEDADDVSVQVRHLIKDFFSGFKE